MRLRGPGLQAGGGEADLKAPQSRRRPRGGRHESHSRNSWLEVPAWKVCCVSRSQATTRLRDLREEDEQRIRRCGALEAVRVEREEQQRAEVEEESGKLRSALSRSRESETTRGWTITPYSPG